MKYQAPTQDIVNSCINLIDLEALSKLSGYEDVNSELIESILEEAGKFASEVLFPLNIVGDNNPARVENGQALTPPGWNDAYAQFVAGGWNGLPFSTDHDGQGLPWLVSAAVQEIWHGSNMAFALCPLLTQGAVEAIENHASDDLKSIYLNKMVSGEWTGTMNLTEPHAGSDLGIIKTKAVSKEDHYLISGQKIYITYGDHDMAENIIHLVLARLEGAPEGVKGISLFLVPKFMVDENKNIAERNTVETVSVEHKLGIHGSPTCVLAYENAKGYLIGEANKGLMYMFTMMNNARHTVGVQANGLADSAYQLAVNYARERVQGKDLSGESAESVAIINHPDVQRMLMKQKCRIEAIRALGLVTAAAMDHSEKNPDPAEATRYQNFVDIMIPIVKGCATEWGVDNVSLALQVHGGMGFIEETGIAQYYRDQRITPIYEGTTGIQALDLVGRKLFKDNGVLTNSVLDNIQNEINAMDFNADCQNMGAELNQAIALLQESMALLLSKDIKTAASVSEPYLQLWGVVSCGYLMAKSALMCQQQLASNQGDSQYNQNKINTAKFYFAHILTLSTSHADAIKQVITGEIVLSPNDFA